jgi:hypothetical protein
LLLVLVILVMEEKLVYLLEIQRTLEPLVETSSCQPVLDETKMQMMGETVV